MAFIRKYRQGDRVYYAKVEGYRDEQGKVRQRVLQWLGTNPEPPPEPIELSGLHFGVLATQLMDGTLSPNDVFDLLDQIGKKPVPLPDLEAVGIRFDFQKKRLTLWLYPKESESTPRKPATASKRGTSRKRKPAPG